MLLEVRVRARARGMQTLLLLLAPSLAAASCTGGSEAACMDPPPFPPHSELLTYFHSIANWVMTTDVGSNNLTCTPSCGPPSHIFINANLARILLAAYKLEPTGPSAAKYLTEGLRWCDSFVDLQIPITTSTGEQAVLWDTGYNQTYIADTGTAIVALALCHELQPSHAAAARYLDSMYKYARFVKHGCLTPPPIGSGLDSGKCPPKGTGWPRPDGGLGDGWYRGTLNTETYTISTATTGSCGLVELDDASHGADAELQKIAVAAVRWLVGSMTADGRIPYIISPHDATATVYQPISYSAESFIDVRPRALEPSHRHHAAPWRAALSFPVPVRPGGPALPRRARQPRAAAQDVRLARRQPVRGRLVGRFQRAGRRGEPAPAPLLRERRRAALAARAEPAAVVLRAAVTPRSEARRRRQQLRRLPDAGASTCPPPPRTCSARVAHHGRSVPSQPAKSASIWVNNKTLPTGFVGLAMADYIGWVYPAPGQSWVTFRAQH